MEAAAYTPDPDRLQLIADTLRKWSPELLQSGLATCAEMEERVVFLEQQRAALVPTDTERCTTVWGGKGFRYKMKHLVRACLMAKDLHRDGHLGKIVRKALEVALPPSVAAYHFSQIEKTTPSHATLSRSRLVLDMGFMIYMQRHVKLQGAIIYGKTDSSPQLGRDWQLTELKYMTPNDLMAVSGAFDRLCDTKDNDEPTLDIREQRQLDGHILVAKVHQHNCPPTSLGSKRAAQLHKLHCFIHALALDVGVARSVLAATFDGMISQTTDQGVESPRINA